MGVSVIRVLVFTVFCIVCTVFLYYFSLCIFILICFVCTSLTLNLLTTTIVAPPSKASKWQMGFNSAFKGLRTTATV